MELIDFADLDRRVQGIAIAVARRSNALSHGAASEDDDVSFARIASSRDSFRELDALSGDTFASSLRDWVAWLTVERVTSADATRARMARHLPLPELDLASGATIKDLVRAALSPSERDARLACDRLSRADTAEGLDAMRRFADRRVEATRLLLGDKPADADLARRVAPYEGAAALSERVLAATQRPFEALGGRGSWGETFRSALVVEAGEGWPAKLLPRWLAGVFGPDLFRGVAIDPVALPAPLGAASFVRAMYAVARAWAFADRPASTPFSMTRRPNDELATMHGALLALAFLEPTFHSKKLGLGRERARAQATAMGRALVSWMRIEALRVAAFPLLRAPSGRRDFEELAERALGRPVPGHLLGLVPFAGPDDAASLLPAVRAFALRDQYRERFDVDWFDNPRAHEALRHEQHRLARDRTELPEEDALRALEARLGDFVNGSP